MGERIRVGSLRFLEETERRQLRRLRLSEVPLLLVRLALLATLIGVLARPVWFEADAGANAPPEHWVLVHPEGIGQLALADAYRAVDSLEAAGASVRLLAPGFPEFDLEETPPDAVPPYDSWSLLREADAELPDGSAITVVGPSRIVDYRGARPVLRASVTWVDLEAASPNRWIASARWIGEDSLHVTVGHSRSTETRFAQYLGEATEVNALLEADGFALDLDPARRRIVLRPADAYPSDDAQTIAEADTAGHILIIHSPARRDDARYVAAALRAVAEAGHEPLSITMETEAGMFSAATRLIFWLHEAPPSDPLISGLREGQTLVSDAVGKGEPVAQRYIAGTARHIGLKRRVAAQNRGQVRWRDSTGEPLLEVDRLGQANWYRFYSRFHPSAGMLVHSSLFPEWIWSLLHEGAVPPVVAPGDRRRITASQRAPIQHAGAVRRAPRPASTPFHQPLWGLVVILFSLERWIAHRQAKTS